MAKLMEWHTLTPVIKCISDGKHDQNHFRDLEKFVCSHPVKGNIKAFTTIEVSTVSQS